LPAWRECDLRNFVFHKDKKESNETTSSSPVCSRKIVRLNQLVGQTKLKSKIERLGMAKRS